MTQQNITLQPNRITPVSMALATGATLYNADTTNAIWVASNPGVAPGAGMRIGPKGSLQWTANNAPVYGCVDTGVATGVQLSISTDIANLNNPVDIGVAVATQLLASGIPSVFLGEVISSGTTMPRLSFGNFGILGLDVSRYASLIITIDTAVNARISAECTTETGGGLGSFNFPITRAEQSVTFAIPITGPRLNLTVAETVDVNTISYRVYGSNRPVMNSRILTGYATDTFMFISGASFGAGGVYEFNNPFISNGKQTYVRFVVTGAGVGKFGYVGFNDAGTEQFVDLIDSAGGYAGTDGKTSELTIILPPGVLNLYYTSTVTATYTVLIKVVQEH